MSQILLFHHALGLTDGVRALAEKIEAGGHTVHLPDLYEGKTFATVEEGVAHLQQVGMDQIVARGVAATAEYRQASVLAGISMGVCPAFKAAQTVPAFRACIAMSAALPLNAYAPLWMPHVALQVHLATEDPWVKDEDLPLARSYASSAEDPDNPADLFEYDTSAHLFMDSSTDGYDEALTDLMVQRIHELLR